MKVSALSNQTNGLIADECQIFVKSNWLQHFVGSDAYHNYSVQEEENLWTEVMLNFNEIDFNKNDITFANYSLLHAPQKD